MANKQTDRWSHTGRTDRRSHTGQTDRRSNTGQTDRRSHTGQTDRRSLIRQTIAYRTDRRSNTGQTDVHIQDRRSHTGQTNGHIRYRTDRRSHTVQDRQTVIYVEYRGQTDRWSYKGQCPLEIVHICYKHLISSIPSTYHGVKRTVSQDKYDILSYAVFL